MFGEVALLISAIVMIRILPQGITGRFFRRQPVKPRARTGPASARCWPSCSSLMFGLPLVTDLFGVVQSTVFVAMAMLALSQGFIWGYRRHHVLRPVRLLRPRRLHLCGRRDEHGRYHLPFFAVHPVADRLRRLLGYFMFYGRISDAYVGVITLTVTVILFNVVNSTAGDVYHIGNAPLGGFNGMPVDPAAEHARRSLDAARPARALATSAWDCWCWSMRCCT